MRTAIPATIVLLGGMALNPGVSLALEATHAGSPELSQAIAWLDAEANRIVRASRRVMTVQCREHDLWGSAFAVFLGVADSTQSMAVAQYFRHHYTGIVQAGQLRHLPAGTYWEAGCARDQYQNGAFWAVPVGWFVYTLDVVDPGLADKTVLDMVRDFKTHGACEWAFGGKRQLPNYLASAALPLDGIRAMLARREGKPLPRQSPVRKARSDS